MADSDPSLWKQLAEQKEREWKEASQKRIESLEKSCRDKEKALLTERGHLHKLKEDFKYNLKLLEERDQELLNYDASFTELRAQVNAKNGEISELKIRLDDLRKAAERESQAVTELQSHYQHRLRERQTEVDTFKTCKDGELEKERAEFEAFRRNLQRRLTEVEDELDTQKRELSTGFEEALKRREHEFRVKADEMGAKVLEYELKAKLLEKELEMLKCTRDQQSEQYEVSEARQRQLEKVIREKEWAVKDVSAMKDARIADLQTKLQQTEKAMARLQEDFQRKFGELDRLAREKESTLGKVKEGCDEREEKLREAVRHLQSQTEDMQIEIRRLEWSNQDLVKDKEVQLGKLREELESERANWEQHMGEVSREQVSRDVELETLRDGDSKLRADIQQKKRDIERYKKDLSQAAERESSLERSKMQLELDWQRRFEDVERHQYDKSEELIKKLTAARDQAVSELKEKCREVEQKDMLLNAVQRDRNIAMATLKQHGIPLNKNINIDTSMFEDEHRRECLELEEQNVNLREVIRQMRHQMEQLGHDMPSATATTVPPSQDYVSSLEREVQMLKQRNRKLEDEVDAKKALQVTPSDSEKVLAEVKDNTIVRNHIQMLNNMLGSVRGEKVELTAQIRKQQARIQYIENQVTTLEKQPRQKQVLIDQLQYEVNAAKRRHEAEVTGLRSRVSDLEQQLVESRKEGDEYYRSSLERNAEVTSLSNELSALKMEISEKRPAVNFGAQELVIQQLQDEILRLKQRGKDPSDLDLSGVMSEGHRQGETTQVSELRGKLKQAVKHISQLAREKQQLIEMGNRLRAELKKTGGADGQSESVRREVPPPRPASPMTKTYSQQYNSKLAELEALQYQLTKQELQYAQTYGHPVMESTDKSLDNVPTKQSSHYQEDEWNQTSSSLGDTRHSQPRPDDRKLLLSMSSGGAESLQEIWNMLDRQSPSIFTPKTPRSRRDVHPPVSPRRQHVSSPRGDGDFQIQGTKSALARRLSPERKSVSVKPKESRKSAPKLRNYNIRDDSSVR